MSVIPRNVTHLSLPRSVCVTIPLARVSCPLPTGESVGSLQGGIVPGRFYADMSVCGRTPQYSASHPLLDTGSRYQDDVSLIRLLQLSASPTFFGRHVPIGSFEKEICRVLLDCLKRQRRIPHLGLARISWPPPCGLGGADEMEPICPSPGKAGEGRMVISLPRIVPIADMSVRALLSVFRVCPPKLPWSD